MKKIIHEFKLPTNKFTPVEKSIYKTLIGNAVNILQITENDVSKMVPCNHSSVSRFMKKVGFNSWKDFIVSLLFEEKIESQIGINSIQEKIFLEITNAQPFFHNEKTKKLIKEITKLISSSDKNLIFYGHRLAGNIAQYLTWIFTQSNKFATHTYFLDELFGMLNPHSLLIVFSDKQGETEVTEAVRKARTLGARIIVINIDESKPIRDIAHITLEVPQLSYFIDYQYNNILKKELLRHTGLVIWETWQNEN